MTLRIISLDLLKTENRSHHHTSTYTNTSLILRRGQEFKFKITFSEELTSDIPIELHFSTGTTPLLSNGSLVLIKVNAESTKKQWRAKICESNGNEHVVEVCSPANAIVGIYSLSILTGSTACFYSTDHIYLLYNPWCEDDDVYMPNEDERQEYVINNTGYIFRGSYKNIKAKPWNFGQFEDNVLDCCMYLMDIGGLKPSSRRNPVIISRKFSAMINSNDDNGVLTGDWSGNYPDGTAPVAWTGSSAILKKYYKEKKPVLYGQCWVFSGVVTTVMRCIGIPARCVTCYSAAHDTEGNLRVDAYYNESGEPLSHMNKDSVWNFHVWNEVWMKRTDLPQGYDGWQVIDATPQERYQGIFQCGPCSVTAIKKGHVYLPYEGSFVFAEVNADKTNWMVHEYNIKGPHTLLKEERSSIGKFISTKKVNKSLREDITSQYKFDEGTEEEREAYQRACSYLNADNPSSCERSAPAVQGIKVKIHRGHELYPGNPLNALVEVTNITDGDKTVDVIISCQLQTYTGRITANLTSARKTVEIKKKQVASIPVTIEADLYMKSVMQVDDELAIRVNVITEIQELRERSFKSRIIHFHYPPIEMEVPETVKTGQQITCRFLFDNTLNIKLENCEMNVEALDIFHLQRVAEWDLNPGEALSFRIKCRPKITGEKKIVADFISTQIKGITMEKIIHVTN
ncbi:protein-glutamine gamma-glutamyltransferase 4 [Xenopus tropicalis]|uniref:protein-glutamine gamma-glutamyltransferase n=1 Tax=Xenopus tropicalis TaxID=8364 RepID=A0A6I8Q8E8_XENTR|nr:protein-glutamine gamma-glutamyltransferase 4 [Xenopus tropicalis]